MTPLSMCRGSNFCPIHFEAAGDNDGLLKVLDDAFGEDDFTANIMINVDLS
jgi:hypothetical protein